MDERKIIVKRLKNSFISILKNLTKLPEPYLEKFIESLDKFETLHILNETDLNKVKNATLTLLQKKKGNYELYKYDETLFSFKVMLDQKLKIDLHQIN